ncbi:MAG TPA: hypothetical protein VL793_16230, partial [Patescibacteria group bacterium]|nr:hypothetical protein [Patescibacteria group bacterium]
MTGGSQLFASADFGANWKDLSLQVVPVGFAFLSIALSADGDKSAIAEYGQGNVLVESHSKLWAGWGDGIAAALLGQGLASAIASSADGTKLATCVNEFDAPDGRLYTSADGGSNWMVTVLPVTNFTSITSSADGTRLAAVAAPDGIYMSTNSGANWSPMNAPQANWVSVASSADGNKMVAVVNGGGIYSWQTTPTPALNIVSSGSSLVLSWTIPSRNFVLQQNTNLNTADWTEVATTPAINFANLHYQVTMSMP